MNDKYVKLADVKRKLRYIFKAYGVNSFVKEKITRALNNLPYSVKGDLETTLEAADVQPVAYAEWVCLEPEIGLYYSCSKCGHNTLQGMYKFCPNCGARMDGDNNG